MQTSIDRSLKKHGHGKFLKLNAICVFWHWYISGYNAKLISMFDIISHEFCTILIIYSNTLPKSMHAMWLLVAFHSINKIPIARLYNTNMERDIYKCRDSINQSKYAIYLCTLLSALTCNSKSISLQLKCHLKFYKYREISELQKKRLHDEFKCVRSTRRGSNNQLQLSDLSDIIINSMRIVWIHWIFGMFRCLHHEY